MGCDEWPGSRKRPTSRLASFMAQFYPSSSVGPAGASAPHSTLSPSLQQRQVSICVGPASPLLPSANLNLPPLSLKPLSLHIHEQIGRNNERGVV